MTHAEPVRTYENSLSSFSSAILAPCCSRRFARICAWLVML